MNSKTYVYPCEIEKNESNSYILIIDTHSDSKLTFEQIKLFDSMLNFGYIPFTEGSFKITDKQIIDFYNYAKTSVLKEMNINSYYSILGLSEPYIRQIPTIQETENFNTDSNQYKVLWENDTTSGKMKSAPKAYKKDGLELYNFEGEKVGSIFPEYFQLYEMIDIANTKWKNWTKTERYSFLNELVKLSKQRNFLIDSKILQASEHIK